MSEGGADGTPLDLALARRVSQHLRANRTCWHNLENHMNLQPHQQRVVAEKTELDEKLTKLDAFGRTALFASLPADEQGRLNRQHSLMEQYSAVLGERIAAFV